MRDPTNGQQGTVKRFAYNGPNSKPKDNSSFTEEWATSLPTKPKPDYSFLGHEPELDDVWSIRKNVSASVKPGEKTGTGPALPSQSGYYSRHAGYVKTSKLNEDTSRLSPNGMSGGGNSRGYSYGGGRSGYSYTGGGGGGAGTGDMPSPRFTTGLNTTQGTSRSPGAAPPLISSSRSPTSSRSSGFRSNGSRGGGDSWSSF